MRFCAHREAGSTVPHGNATVISEFAELVRHRSFFTCLLAMSRAVFMRKNIGVCCPLPRGEDNFFVKFLYISRPAGGIPARDQRCSGNASDGCRHTENV